MMAKALRIQSKLSIKVMLTSRCGNRTTVYLLSPRSRTFSRYPILSDIDTEQNVHISSSLIASRFPSLFPELLFYIFLILVSHVFYRPSQVL